MPRAAAQQFVRAGLLHTIDIPEAGSFGSIGYSVRSNKDLSPACELFVECLREVSETTAQDGGTSTIPGRHTRLGTIDCAAAADAPRLEARTSNQESQMVPTGKHKPELMKLVGEVLGDLEGRPLDAEMESRLNEHFGPQTATYRRLSELLSAGVEEGWAAYVDIQGPNYRRGRLAEPSTKPRR
jgi:hypothetical protein